MACTEMEGRSAARYHGHNSKIARQRDSRRYFLSITRLQGFMGLPRHGGRVGQTSLQDEGWKGWRVRQGRESVRALER